MAITDTQGTRSFTIKQQRIGIKLPVSMWSLFASLGDNAPTMQALYADWEEATPLDRRMQYGFVAYLMSAIPVLASERLTALARAEDIPPAISDCPSSVPMLRVSVNVPDNPDLCFDSMRDELRQVWYVDLLLTNAGDAIAYSTFVYQIRRHEKRHSLDVGPANLFELEDGHKATKLGIYMTRVEQADYLNAIANKFCLLFPSCDVTVEEPAAQLGVRHPSIKSRSFQTEPA